MTRAFGSGAITTFRRASACGVYYAAAPWKSRISTPTGVSCSKVVNGLERHEDAPFDVLEDVATQVVEADGARGSVMTHCVEVAEPGFRSVADITPQTDGRARCASVTSLAWVIGERRRVSSRSPGIQSASEEFSTA